jgi:galactokinase
LEKINDAIERLENNFYDDRLTELYGDRSVEEQIERYIKILKWHSTFFKTDHAMIISSPGRIELGGNHTDHNGGIVLAASINLDSVAVVTKTENNIVTVNSENYPLFKVDLSDLTLKEDEKGKTEALIRGISSSLVSRGYKIGGFNASVVSEIQPGSGLSSSASIEILLGSIFNSLYNKNGVTITELAKIGKEAENIYFGKPCGLMDPLACGTGGIISINFINQESPELIPIDFEFDNFGYEIFIVNTGDSYSHLAHEFEAIPEEMVNAAHILGKERCCESDEKELLSKMKDVRDKNGDRSFLRALHFFRENKRVKQMINSLLHNEIDEYIRLVNSSGNSSFKYLQNCYSNDFIKKQGIPIGLALSEGFLDGKGACRVHGGGFAGTILAYVPIEMAGEYKIFMESFFGEKSVKNLKIRDASAGPVLLT